MTTLDQTELQQLLAESDAFAALSADELQQCASLLELVHYSLGQQVCQAGEEADAFYVVYSGRARVVAEPEPGKELTVGTLTRGNHFGEQGLLANARRQYTVRAASDLDLLRLSRADFERLLESQPELRGYFANYVSDLAVRNFLKLSQLFAPLSPTEIRGLLSLLQTRSYAANDVILREGKEADALYLLRQGSVRLVQESQGNKIVGRLRTGESFGLTPLLTGQANAATVMADEKVEVFWLGRENFEKLAAATPKFRESLATVAAAPMPIATAAPLATAPPPFLRESQTTTEPATNGFKRRRALRYPALLQLSETDCGAACLAMILRYNGKHVSINRLRELANV